MQRKLSRYTVSNFQTLQPTPQLPRVDISQVPLATHKTHPMSPDNTTTGTARGKPGAFARDTVRVADTPIPINYHRSNTGGHYL